MRHRSAITNLKKTTKGTYADIENFGVTRQIEPGSTFKVASVMAYLEDYNGTINDTIDCKNGKYKFKLDWNEESHLKQE